MNIEQLRRFLQDGKLTIGVRQTKRLINSGEAQSIVIASNAPELEAQAVRDRAATAGIEVVQLDATNTQLGTMCRKPHAISFCAVTK